MSVLVHGVAPSQMQYFAFAKLHKVPISPFLQLLNVLLNSSPALQHL